MGSINAQAATLDRSVERNVRNTGGSDTLRNTYTGRESITPGHIETRSYLVFDLASVTSPIASASLRLELNAYFGTALGQAYPEGSAIGQANFADIGTGNVYGTSVALPSQAAQSCTSNGPCSGSYFNAGDILTVILNPTAVADINARLGGKFAVGFKVDDVGPGNTVFGELKGVRFRADFGEPRVPVAELVLEEAAIPEPSTFGLICSGLLFIPMLRRRIR
jgi:hypothetical protein